MVNKLIVLEGPEMSGKSTQLKLLQDQLKPKYKETIMFKKFPSSNKEPSAFLPRTYINEGYKNISPKAVAALFLGDILHQFDKEGIADFHLCGGTIILERYFTSILTSQAYKFEQWNDFMEFSYWLTLFSKEFGLPKAEKVFFLNMPPEVSLQLKGNFEENNRLNTAVKIVKNYEFSLKLAKSCDWTIINCCEFGVLKSKEEINNEISASLLFK